MNASDNDPLGPWDHRFTLVEELGCIPTLIGFALFLAVAIVLWRVLFN
jgi:hypothetical protein